MIASLRPHVILAPFVINENLSAYLELQRAIAQSPLAPYFETTLDALEAREEIVGKIAHLIRHDGRFAGFISHEQKMDESGAYGHIYELAVFPSFQKQGIGNEALHQVLESHYPSMAVRLRVDPHNVPALQTYLKQGFVPEDWVRNATKDGRPRIVMLRPKPIRPTQF